MNLFTLLMVGMNGVLHQSCREIDSRLGRVRLFAVRGAPPDVSRPNCSCNCCYEIRLEFGLVERRNPPVARRCGQDVIKLLFNQDQHRRVDYAGPSSILLLSQRQWFTRRCGLHVHGVQVL